MSQFLHLYLQNALSANRDLVPRLRGPAPALRDVLELCTNYRIAGIGFLLLSGTADEFRQRLQQSGAAYGAFLERAPDGEKRGGAALPFFDAVASGDLVAAARIAQASPRAWRQGLEYEEDFLFPEVLMQRFFLGAAPEACAALLARWERALAGAADPRLDACGGLLRADPDAFDPGLVAFLGERRVLHERAARRELDPPWVRDTVGKVSVEALALLRLAGLAGIATEPEHPGAPSLARGGAPASVRPDSWLTPE